MGMATCRRMSFREGVAPALSTTKFFVICEAATRHEKGGADGGVRETETRRGRDGARESNRARGVSSVCARGGQLTRM